MAILDSLARLAANLLGILHTRLELVSLEVEEELARYASYLLQLLVVLFCAGVAILLAILLVIAVFWDSHREAALLTLIALFGATAIGLGWRLKISLARKPRLFTHSLAELRKDSTALSGERSQSGSGE
jgi:uncharacterized membrane protein YqjE